MHHDYITSSELSFGDIVFNNCDPDQFQISYCDQDTIAILYRVIAYSLYAKRVVIPSRYLLSAGSAFDAVKTLTPLLEEGELSRISGRGTYPSLTMSATSKIQTRSNLITRSSSMSMLQQSIHLTHMVKAIYIRLH